MLNLITLKKKHPTSWLLKRDHWFWIVFKLRFRILITWKLLKLECLLKAIKGNFSLLLFKIKICECLIEFLHFKLSPVSFSLALLCSTMTTWTDTTKPFFIFCYCIACNKFNHGRTLKSRCFFLIQEDKRVILHSCALTKVKLNFVRTVFVLQRSKDQESEWQHESGKIDTNAAICCAPFRAYWLKLVRTIVRTKSDT